jgi:ubiquinol-cytochrome c reductase core subunit 2
VEDVLIFVWGKAHEFHEEVTRVIGLQQASLDAISQALDLAHASAFHNGLGAQLYPTSSTPVGAYLNESSVASFAQAAYNKANIAVVADGATQEGLAKWIEPLFKSVPASSSSQLALNTTPSKYFGGEQRSSRVGQNAYVIAFPGASLADAKPETSVLVALLGGESSISWTTGFTLLSKAVAAAPHTRAHASNLAYSDAGLLTLQISGPAASVKTATEESVKALKSIASGSVTKEDLTKAIAKAKFDLLSSRDVSGTGLVAAGTNLVQGGKALQAAEAIKALESVTAEKLKAVSNFPSERLGIG